MAITKSVPIGSITIKKIIINKNTIDSEAKDKRGSTHKSINTLVSLLNVFKYFEVFF